MMSLPPSSSVVAANGRTVWLLAVLRCAVLARLPARFGRGVGGGAALPGATAKPTVSALNALMTSILRCRLGISLIDKPLPSAEPSPRYDGVAVTIRDRVPAPGRCKAQTVAARVRGRYSRVRILTRPARGRCRPAPA